MMRRIKIEIELEIQIFTSRCLNVLHNSRLFYIYKIFYIVNLGYVGSGGGVTIGKKYHVFFLNNIRTFTPMH